MKIERLPHFVGSTSPAEDVAQIWLVLNSDNFERVHTDLSLLEGGVWCRTNKELWTFIERPDGLWVAPPCWVFNPTCNKWEHEDCKGCSIFPCLDCRGQNLPAIGNQCQTLKNTFNFIERLRIVWQSCSGVLDTQDMDWKRLRDYAKNIGAQALADRISQCMIGEDD